MPEPSLGERLQAVRLLRKLSLNAVATQADISATYLQKLERGEVQKPGPHVLHRLAQVLRVPYHELMRLAGYVVPRPERTSTEARGNVLQHALFSEELSDEEAEALATYLAWYRHQQQGSPGQRERRGA